MADAKYGVIDIIKYFEVVKLSNLEYPYRKHHVSKAKYDIIDVLKCLNEKNY